MNSRYLKLSLSGFLAFLLIACTSIREMSTDGPVEEDYGRRTQGTIVEDRDIESKTTINLKRDQAIDEDANIQVKSFNRVVLLTGQVPNQQNKNQAARVAQKVRHVRSIHNELQIGPSVGFGQRSKDRMLATRIRTRLMAADDVESGRVEMVVEDGVVYLMGLVTRAESQRIIHAAQQSSGIQKIVKVFEYIDDIP